MNRKRIEKILHNCSKTIDVSVNRVGASNEIFKYIEDLEQQVEKLQEENKQLKDLIDTILTFSFFKEECPLNFVFEDNSKEDEAQNIFYSDEYCENNCNDIYKECWLKYFKELQGSRE